jgi:hypothetical protein
MIFGAATVVLAVSATAGWKVQDRTLSKHNWITSWRRELLSCMETAASGHGVRCDVGVIFGAVRLMHTASCAVEKHMLWTLFWESLLPDEGAIRS